jgi:lambda repressor-like predicted transcriptional regulator
MDLATLDREDVIAGLRKRFRSVAAFERVASLPEKSVSDVLRGRSSARVEAAIVEALSTPVSSFRQSEGSDDSATPDSAHRQNAGAR